MGLPANKLLQELTAIATQKVLRLEHRFGSGDKSDPNLSDRRDKAWDDLLTLTGLAHTRNQRALYSQQTGNSWESTFWRVREMRFASAFGLEGYDLVRYLWQELPDSRFKRFQEIFSDPTSYSIPRASLDHPRPCYPSREALNACPLRAVLVSPDRIPSKLAQDLGLIRWRSSALKPIEALERKGQDEVVQGLKSIWETTAALDPKNNRILVIGGGAPQDVDRYPAAKAIANEVIGSLIYIREEQPGKIDQPRPSRNSWIPPKKVASFYPTIYSALRKTLHERAYYDAEKSKLGGLSVDWEILNSRIRTEWRRGASDSTKRDLKEDILHLTRRSLQTISQVTNREKKECIDLLARVEERIAGGSNNISAILAQTLAALRRLDRRLTTVPLKGAANDFDGISLRRTISDAVRRFALFNTSLHAAGLHLEREITATVQTLDVTAFKRRIETWLTHPTVRDLKSSLRAIEGIPVRPFNTFARHISSAFEALSDGVSRGDLQEAQRAFVTMVALARLQNANIALERLRGYTTMSQLIPAEEAGLIASSLRTYHLPRSPFPFSAAPEHAKACGKVSGVASRVASILERYHSHGREVDAESLSYQKIVRYLERLDIEALIRVLPHIEALARRYREGLAGPTAENLPKKGV